jgi:hypothetical protein
MRKLILLRLLICFVGTLALAATAVIGASLTDSAVTNDAVVAPSAEQLAGPLRSPVDLEPPTASVDDSAALAGVDAGESPTPDGAIGDGAIGNERGGTLEGADATVRNGPDAAPEFVTLNIEAGDVTLLAAITTGISQAGFTTDSGGVAGAGRPYTGSSAEGAPSFVGLGNDTGGRDGDTASAAPVPEVATFFLVLFPVLAALVARLRG